MAASALALAVAAIAAPELRDLLADRLRARAADLAERVHADPAEAAALAGSLDADRIAALEAGEPVGVQGWELRGLIDGPPAMARLLLAPDGTLSETR